MGLTRIFAPLAGLALAATSACGSSAQEPPADGRYASASAGDLSLRDGWATEAPKAPASSGGDQDMASTMSSVSGAYFTLRNDGDTDDALVSASTPAAAETQLHTTESTAGGSSGTMKRVARVPVPAGGTTRLEVGGYHLMLIGPTRALEAGDRVPVELRFASGTEIDVRLPVLDRADRPS